MELEENENYLENSRLRNNSFLYSALVHALAASFLFGMSDRLIGGNRKIPEQSALASLYSRGVQLPDRREPLIYFVNVGSVPTGGTPEAQYQNLEGRIGDDIKGLRDIAERMAEDVRGIGESIDRISKSLNEGLATISKSFEEMNQSLEEIKSAIERRTKLYGGLEVILSQNGDIARYYTDSFQPNERNENSYVNFFNIFAEVYLNLNNKYEPILPILNTNSALSRIMDVTLDVNQDGAFKILKIEPLPGFNDENGIVSNHYKELLDKMPKKFAPPEAAGLQSPYQLQFSLLNPARIN